MDNNLERIVTKGLIVDIHVADSHYSIFKAIADNFQKLKPHKEIAHFFIVAQHSIIDTFLLAIFRLFDKPSRHNNTLCIQELLNCIRRTNPPITQTTY